MHLREQELAILRGDGVADKPREKKDRIYDYDVRCKTGRRPTKSDPLSESRSSDVYVPRDEAFSEIKNLTFSFKTVYSPLTRCSTRENLPPLDNKGFLGNVLPRLLKAMEDAQNDILRFETPSMIERDKFGWIRDEEFCRQTIAGLNPLSISCVTEWPLKSKLDPEVYGPPESAITEEIIMREIRGFCTLRREQKNFRTTLYGSRTLMFLMPTGTLRPLAIELVRPPGIGKPQWKRVFTPCWDSTGAWLWKLAKVHALGLLLMIVVTISSIKMSSIAYGRQWRFDREALPADLIARGMAVEDPDSPHGLKLAVEDYPYANDEENLVETDSELQTWWTEIRRVGHGDKKDEPWWPVLKTPKDLIGILTTIICVTSGHHAAVNFGQYDFAGYIPNRATIARVKMPCEDPTDDEWETFKRRPEDELLSAFPSQLQASQIMAILDVLSNHSPDEEYLGETIEGPFEANPQIKVAFEIFAGRLKELDGIIDGRNADESRKNRNGVGVVPYNLLKPLSEPGTTC
ncbi:hypothetical protein L1887_18877 [Cichorium endivia]|nr:hypothetical protein L1887_18877 [Cichorium endivia]